MNNKEIRKICVIVASRANYGRVKTVMKAIQGHPKLSLQVIASASALLWRFGDVAKIIQKDGFNIDAKIYSVVEGENLVTMAKSTGIAISELATSFETLKPDFVVTVADRYETIATAIAASYMNIPVVHIQGGEVTGSIDESVRHAITKLSHLHFPATHQAAKRVIQLGENPDFVVNVGCPSLDTIKDFDLSIPKDFFAPFGSGQDDIDPTKPFLLVLQHPVTTEFGSGLKQVTETLKAVHALNMQTVWLWPNIDAGSDDVSKGLRLYREKNKDSRVRFYINFEVEDYYRLLNNCACMIGNSSSGIREGAFLGTPTVNIGTRQQGRERAPNVTDVGYDGAAIQAAIEKQLKHGKYALSDLYGTGKAAAQIADILSTINVPIQKKLHY